MLVVLALGVIVALLWDAWDKRGSGNSSDSEDLDERKSITFDHESKRKYDSSILFDPVAEYFERERKKCPECGEVERFHICIKKMLRELREKRCKSCDGELEHGKCERCGQWIFPTRRCSDCFGAIVGFEAFLQLLRERCSSCEAKRNERIASYIVARSPISSGWDDSAVRAKAKRSVGIASYVTARTSTSSGWDEAAVNRAKLIQRYGGNPFKASGLPPNEFDVQRALLRSDLNKINRNYR